MASLIVSFCLYQVDTTDTGVAISTVHAPISSTETYHLNLYYFEDNSSKTKVAISSYQAGTFENSGYTIPYYHFNENISRVFYLANSSSSNVFAPPMMFRADNGSVVVIDDSMEAIENSIYGVSVFTDITPNADGCITLDIHMKNTPNPNDYATIYYYVPELPGQIVTQTFPIYLLDDNHFRLGFKTFYTTDSEEFTSSTIPIVWVSFSNSDTTPIVGSSHI